MNHVAVTADVPEQTEDSVTSEIQPTLTAMQPKPGAIVETCESKAKETPMERIFKIASEILSTEKQYVRVLGLIEMVNLISYK